MTDLRSHIFPQAKQARFRVGIKWDPLERDDLAEAHALESPAAARVEYAKLARALKAKPRPNGLVSLFSFIPFIRDYQLQEERLRTEKEKRRKALAKYLAQEKMESFDLDLCAFCYDKNGKRHSFVSPVSVEEEEAIGKESAFIHSGDDMTGTGDLFDEDMQVNLSALDPAIESVFFVIVSNHHGFDEIKGGSWSFINTWGETEIFSATLKTQKKDRLHVIGRLMREEESWKLQEIADYCPLDDSEALSLDQRVDAVLSSRYIPKANV